MKHYCQFPDCLDRADEHVDVSEHVCHWLCTAHAERIQGAVTRATSQVSLSKAQRDLQAEGLCAAVSPSMQSLCVRTLGHAAGHSNVSEGWSH